VQEVAGQTMARNLVDAGRESGVMDEIRPLAVGEWREWVWEAVAGKGYVRVKRVM